MINFFKFNILSDICEWDWGSISTFLSAVITATTALYISFSWKGKNRQELKAVEAKELLLRLLEFRDNVVVISTDLSWITDDQKVLQGKNKIENLKSEATLIRNKISYFNRIFEYLHNEAVVKVMDDLVINLIKYAAVDNLDKVGNESDRFIKEYDKKISNFEDRLR